MNGLSILLRKLAESFKRDFTPKWEIHPVKKWLLIDPADGEGYLNETGEVRSDSPNVEKIQCTIIGFPTLRQAYTYDCGASAVSTILQFYGYDEREEQAMKGMKTDKSGTSITHIVDYFKKHGFQVVAKSSTVDEIKGWIDQCLPVILSLQAWPDNNTDGWQDKNTSGHYVIAVGYTDQHIICSDPSSVYDSYIPYAELDRRWHDEDDGKIYDHYVIVPSGQAPVYEHNRIMKLG